MFTKSLFVLLLVGATNLYAKVTLPPHAEEVFQAVAKQRQEKVDLRCVQKEEDNSYRLNFGDVYNSRSIECEGGDPHFSILMTFDEEDQILSVEIADA